MTKEREGAGKLDLGEARIGPLLLRYAVPGMIAMLVSALYNIVDQIFIGNGVGVNGNAATNVAFPLTTLCTAVALLLGNGGAANFNLAMGAGEKEKAAKIAQATEFIEEKAHTYESPIAQGGTNVSGGQKQRLSIARAIAKKPEIFIFDDSFSALDYKTDVVLRRELKKATKDATTLIVAQRISTILHADKIIVLDLGKIVGMGTHQELLKSCDVYRQIAMSQLSEEELANE